MSKIIIGKADGKNFLLPRETVTSTIVILGGKGMGKTNLGGVLVEGVDAQGDNWCVIDPLGVWWGLRHSIDGKGPGIECVILGGPHGDIPIEPTGGAIAADLVVDEGANVILDISRKSNGEMWTMGERIRFAKDFAKRLFQRQGELVDGRRRDPIFVELDEAATFIPQMFPSGNIDIAECISAWQTLVEWGRNVGIGIGLLTQRSARINKSVTEVADALISFRIVGPNSIKAVTDWLGEHVPKESVREHVETLRSLERGRALIVSPGWLKFEGVVDIRLRHTFDSSATPKPGERQKRVTGKAAKPDLTKYQERMKETIERAKENDPKALKAQIQQLRGELKAAGKTRSAIPAKTTVKAHPLLARSLREMRSLLGDVMKVLAKVNLIGFEGAGINTEEITAALFKASAEIQRIATKKIEGREREFERLKDEMNRLLKRLQSHLSEEEVKVDVDVTKNEPVTVRSVPAPRPRPEVVVNVDGVTPAQMKLVRAAAEFHAIGIPDVSKKWLAARAGASHKSSAYSNNLGALRSRGLLDYRNGNVFLTQAGMDIAGPQQHPLDQEEMAASCRHLLTPAQCSIFDALYHAYPHGMSREDLAQAARASSTSSAFSNNLGAMRSAGMIDYGSDKTVHMQKWIFLENGDEARRA